MLVQRERWLQKRQEAGRTFVVDPVKFAGGITLIQQYRGFPDDGRLHDAALAAAGAIGAGLCELAWDMGYLADRIRGSLDCQAVYVDLDDSGLHRRATEMGIKETSLVVFLRCVERLMLSVRAREMAVDIDSLSWKKGYCPVCGRASRIWRLSAKRDSVGCSARSAVMCGHFPG